MEIPAKSIRIYDANGEHIKTVTLFATPPEDVDTQDPPSTPFIWSTTSDCTALVEPALSHCTSEHNENATTYASPSRDCMVDQGTSVELGLTVDPNDTVNIPSEQPSHPLSALTSNITTPCEPTVSALITEPGQSTDPADEIEVVLPTYTEPNSSWGLQSSHAKAIANVLSGCPTEVKLLDATTVQIEALKRANRKPPQSVADEHKRLLAVLQQKVISRRAQVRSSIETCMGKAFLRQTQ